MNAAALEWNGVQSVIERRVLAGHSSSENAQWIQEWKKLRAEGWDVQVLTETVQTRGRRNVVALVGIGCKKRGAHGGHQRPGSHARPPSSVI